jgi:hypothetical protein
MIDGSPEVKRRRGGGRAGGGVHRALLDLLGAHRRTAAGQHHQLVHDLVGDLPLDPVAGQATKREKSAGSNRIGPA